MIRIQHLSLFLLAGCGVAGSLTLGATSLIPVPGSALTREAVNGERLPGWGGGAYVEVLNDGTPKPDLQAFDISGKQILAAKIDIPNAQFVRVRGVSRGSDGSTAVCGFFVYDDGHKRAFFTLVDAEGKTHRVIETDPYIPYRIALSPDGTIWTVGNLTARQLVRQGTSDPDPKGAAIRHFDKDGKLLASFGPPAGGPERLRNDMGFLAACHDRVGWVATGEPFIGKPRRASYLEIRSDGTTKEYYLPDEVRQGAQKLRGFALTEAGGVFVTIVAPGGKEEMFELDRQTDSWSLVNLPGIPSLAGSFLYGASGNTLAIWAPDSPRIRFFQVASK